MTNLTSITKWWEKFLGSFPSHCEQLDDTSETDPDTLNTSVVSQESTISETERQREREREWASMLKYFDLFLSSAGGGDKTLIWGDLLSSNGLGLVCARQDQWSALSHHCSLRTLLESDWCVPRVSRYEHYDDDLIPAHIGSNLASLSHRYRVMWGRKWLHHEDCKDQDFSHLQHWDWLVDVLQDCKYYALCEYWWLQQV